MNSETKSQLNFIIKSSQVIAFSGSRNPHAAEIKALLYIVPKVPKSAQIYVGCANGIDNLVVKNFPQATVFKASDYRTNIKSALALRSTHCVKSVPDQQGLIIAIPAGPCPTDVKPSCSFAGHGSGTWGTIALAIGLQKRVCIFSPHPPKWVGEEIEKNWWYYQPPQKAMQMSLF
ncbi:hypothetical protein [Cylindrospermopsis raciborskii]|uniref:hypothetical protein n=1 Tax=Cylindrospermopsis raciborskii TaxID=77022 RepID=UPI0022C3B813|nr:hypothetical protein [Cylindrospermopsis raciborskii]MCZ2207321.1 hypothetical protein [Cylindrospermopsis raciborskii PAMP2011]